MNLNVSANGIKREHTPRQTEPSSREDDIDSTLL